MLIYDYHYMIMNYEIWTFWLFSCSSVEKCAVILSKDKSFMYFEKKY